MSKSHLFYQTTSRRPRVARSEGIYLWDTGGRRYIDASSGPMVSNIGHSNPRVLAAMRRQMDRATFAYRLHFENDAVPPLTILGAWDAEVDQRIFANGSGLAEALLGRSVGDETEVEGKTVTIAKIEAWQG